jgi:hypothetical protein
MIFDATSALAEIEAAEGETQFYRPYLEIVRHATPLEVREILAGCKRLDLPKPIFRKIAGLNRSAFRHKKQPEPFTRVDIDPGVSLYRGSATTGRRLLFVFDGYTHVVFMPTPVFLQYFPADTYDIVLVRDLETVGFTKGIAGIDRDFPGLIRKLAEITNAASARRVMSVGMSGGGAAGLAAGALLGARSSVSVGGHLATTSRRYGTTPEAIAHAALFERIRFGWFHRGYAIFGSDYAVDKRNAEELARITGLKLMPIAGISRHNSLQPLHRRGVLRRLFKQVGLL